MPAEALRVAGALQHDVGDAAAQRLRSVVLEVAVAADGAALGATRVLEEHAND